MRYPNLRYGNPAELNFYAIPYTTKALAKMLRRDERTVKDWLSTKQRVPWWVPEIMRLKHMEAVERSRQMGFAPLRANLCVATGDVLTLYRPPQIEKPQITDLRLDDFDTPQPISSCA